MTTGTTRRGAAVVLSAHVAERTAHAPDTAAVLASRALIDTVGVALAAAEEPSVRITHSIFGDLVEGTATVLVGGRRADPVRAAWLNGTAAHALDFDDVDDLIIGHPSTVLVPAALAVGQLADTTMADVADAYWRGLTTMRALAAGLGVRAHYTRGWHSTATLGVFGATAVAARLLRLDQDVTGHAFGIAASRAAGSRQNFGSMTKPMHAGSAASDGVLAAILAQRGLTADPAALDGPQGFFTLYSGDDVTGVDPTRAVQRMRAVLDDPPAPVVNTKRHACCYAIHAAADATLDLVAGGLAAADVGRVTVSVPPGTLGPLITRPPRTGLEGKFSMGYVVAACISGDQPGLATFTDDAVARQDVADLARRVQSDDGLAVDGAGDGDRLGFRARVTVQTRDGRTLVQQCDAPLGHATRPLDEAQVRTKFEDCVGFVGALEPDQVYTALSRAQADTRLADAMAPLARISTGGSR